MCILIASCLHPDYPLILLSNRDEYFSRSTQLAQFIESTPNSTAATAAIDIGNSHSEKIVNGNSEGVKLISETVANHDINGEITKTKAKTVTDQQQHSPLATPQTTTYNNTNAETTRLLMPYDLQREEHGTWIGVNSNGKICVLVNYREPFRANASSKISRGSIPLEFLNSDLSTHEWENYIRNKTENFKLIGGFSFFYGDLKYNPIIKNIEPFKIISNRCDYSLDVFQNRLSLDSSIKINEEKLTIALSNSRYDEPWPKIQLGKNKLNSVISESIEKNWDQDKLVDSLFESLSVKVPNNNWEHLSYEEAFLQMKQTIFVPPVRTNSEFSKYYGTRTQTVILVDKSGELTYIEKNLHSTDDLSELPKINKFKFKINNWVDINNISSSL
ncbi:unnamed protein product [[Candida] boidinii]|uniref:Unnamed protein product n=1 Tax=Candida boidinii TaxID=5477 RepID=A0A9W6T189_CANBO|nr:hypothetical protein B5S30_g1056 [[Candida] boidinii]OWB82371.1 hypothetical protein B5S33_g996 [[Candida] boidinii]GME73622.1 unnamed protein product [[Candida] boidinii]